MIGVSDAIAVFKEQIAAPERVFKSAPRSERGNGTETTLSPLNTHG
jgi:hypothetical protein